MDNFDGGPISPSSSIQPSPGLLNMNHFTLDITPAPDSHLVPQSSAAKQPKKRKSWGQALPEPKTSLPPRKRAKTDDEKEQRRIERIKRNRAAAHNSRERKRVEAERLEVENIHLKHQLASMQQHLLRQHAQLTEFQRLVPNALPQLSSEDFASMKFDLPEIKDESSSSNAGTPASSVDTSVDTIDPRASFSDATPHEDMSTPFIKAESPAMSMTMPTPSATPANGTSLDQTQHSAAMLFDLQCQSSKASPMVANGWWAQVILHLMHMNIMTCYRTLLAVSWTLWPARIARIMDMTSPSTTSSRTCSSPTFSAATRTTRATRQQRIAPSATSTTPFSLPSYLSLLLLSQTSAQFFLAKGLQPEDASAARLALFLSKLGEQKTIVGDGESEGAVLQHLDGRLGRLFRRARHRSRHDGTENQGNGKHDDGGVG